MSRREFSNPTKRDAWERSGGVCECHRVPMLKRPAGCGMKLGEGNTFYEHITPDAFSSDNSLGNCAVLTKTCWREKTREFDRPTIDKSNRQRDRARGIRGRGKGWYRPPKRRRG